MLKVENLTLKTRHTILDDFSFTFEKGNIYGVVAPNGSGKTTFFRAINALIPVTNGHIQLEKGNISTKRRERFYFEDNSWFDSNLSGYDYLVFVKQMWQSEVDISNVINQLHLQEYIKLPIKKYSLGMKQKVIIAMYIVSDADYLIMDEISNGLDEDNRKALFAILEELVQKNKMIMISSHYLDEIICKCSYVLELKNAKFEVAAL
ncbi:ABC transporter ATP-binding protein [Aerococcaceae bacterium zg-ZUI334]|uniref:ATP-binding cassette domain-containing protein n=1 Tax=Aerococcaceae bacterium zg-252 TaxID=2796928 RepID=UPI001B91BF08|nr:ABC transporter ATP-binding protein [Aerococcaceae bacterium zg-ZUI334]